MGKNRNSICIDNIPLLEGSNMDGLSTMKSKKSDRLSLSIKKNIDSKLKAPSQMK